MSVEAGDITLHTMQGHHLPLRPNFFASAQSVKPGHTNVCISPKNLRNQTPPATRKWVGGPLGGQSRLATCFATASAVMVDLWDCDALARAWI